MSDIRAAKENIPILPDSIYPFDKGYYDLNWFQAISRAEIGYFRRDWAFANQKVFLLHPYLLKCCTGHGICSKNLFLSQ